MSLNHTEVIPGSPIRLTETVPIGLAASVDRIHHRVVRIGIYDADQAELIPLDVDEYSTISADAVFDDLPETLAHSHAGEFAALTPQTKGTEIGFTARRLGIFLIHASWSVKGDARKIYGAPIVLAVSPPRDEKGKPVVKPDWLKADE